MSSITVPAVNSIAMDNRRPVQSMAVFVVALGYHLQICARAVGDLTERCFAEFAGVPCVDPLNRQEWEDLWETDNCPP